MAGSTKEYEFWGEKALTFEKDTNYICLEESKKLIGEWFKEVLSSEDTVLEVAAGPGNYTKLISPYVKKVYSTDMSDSMLNVAKLNLSEFKNVEVKKEDAYSLSLKDNSLDVVVMCNLLHIVKSPEMPVKEAMRVLKKGGSLLVLDYTSCGMKFIDKLKFIIRYLKTWKGMPPFSHNLNVENLKHLVLNEGFHVSDCKMCGKKAHVLLMHSKK